METKLVSPPTPKQFYIDFPLYEEFTFPLEQNAAGWRIKYFEGTMDAYCTECADHSIFSRSLSSVEHAKDSWIGDHLFSVSISCSRNKKHSLYFVFKVAGRTMQKVGQFPSLASLNLYDVRKYGAVLNKATFQELTKAIGLAAHGIGIGSFVYLRRIFEGLVEEAHIAAKAGAAWNEELYGRSRMGERIPLLADFLPAFLVENKSMYSILSTGIHELTEAECLAAFPVVKIGIEIILDAKIQAAAQRKKLESATLAIQNLTSQGGR
jgi:hypothetical protein